MVTPGNDPHGADDAATPCVAVVGMGRSGTSATTGLLVQLGLTGPRPDDLIPEGPSNERGHWESETVHRCNVRLLRALGCTTYAPPQLRSCWDDVAGFPETQAIARQWFTDTHTGGPVVVKDPRLCLTLNFWRDTLAVPMAAVFVLRDPINVARSHEARDGISMSLALAIWDRYLRAAVRGLEGLPTFVVEYDDLLADPGRGTADLAGFLRHVGIGVTEEVEAAASSWLDTGLRHHKDATEDEYRDMANVQLSIFDLLREQAGLRDPWTPSPLPSPPLWVDDIIGVQRRFAQRTRELRSLQRSTPRARVARVVRHATDRFNANPSAGTGDGSSGDE